MGGATEGEVRVYTLEGDAMHRLWGPSLAARPALEEETTACILAPDCLDTSDERQKGEA